MSEIFASGFMYEAPSIVSLSNLPLLDFKLVKKFSNQTRGSSIYIFLDNSLVSNDSLLKYLKIGLRFRILLRVGTPSNQEYIFAVWLFTQNLLRDLFIVW